jgi:signal transduction histidine kinase
VSAVVICLILISYEMRITFLHPAWTGSVTDWLRAALAWPELLIVVFVSVWFSRTHRPSALSWWMWSAALLSYVIARNLWTIDDQMIFHHGVPFPSFPDYFFLLQYPFFFLAVVLLPRTRYWGRRLILILDGLLVMGAATALSWYFILSPLYTVHGLSVAARWFFLAYPIGDLFVLYALTVTLLHGDKYHVYRLVIALLVLAVVCLMIADTWVAWLLVHPNHTYTTGNPPDLFWFAFYLLFPLAALVQLRVAQHEPLTTSVLAVNKPSRLSVGWHDLTASIRFFFPIIVALLASAAILIHSTLTTAHSDWNHLTAPFAVSFVLLFLVIVRQEITFLENAWLLRQTDAARANEYAQREISQRKDEFLGIVSHELKTPLTSLQGYMQLMARRFNTWRPQQQSADDLARHVTQARRAIEYSTDSVQRMTRLVDDLLDDARIREGRLAFHMVPCDLREVVRKAVHEQQALAAERTIHLEVPASRPVSVVADAMRIEQVVTNYLSNALKYSREEQPVTVRLEVAGGLARVAVRDAGPGVPEEEQVRVWERFHRIAGVAVQSGSGVGLGIGLYICKTIVEAHQGRVGVRSVPGQGATFWFTLPLSNTPD